MAGKSKDAKKPKKEKKPKMTLQEKVAKEKEKIQRTAAAKIAKAEGKLKKAEQAEKNKEKKEQNKEKKLLQKEANAVKKLEKKQEKAEQKAEKKALAKIRKQEIKDEKRALKMQKRAELAARTPLQKKVDRKRKLRRTGIVLIVIVLLSAISFAGVKSAPMIAKKLNIPKFNIAEKIPFLKEKPKEDDKADKDGKDSKDKKDSKDEKDVNDEKNTPQEPEVVDDVTLIVAGSKVLHPYYTEALGKFLELDKATLKEQSSVLTNEEAFTNLINGDCQVIFSHLPTEKENRMASMAGKTLNPVPILNGGFVFITNKENPVKNLTKTQLYNIYTGTITNWKDLGGDDAPIVAMQRSGKSAAQTTMYQEIVNEEEIQKVSAQLKPESTSDIINAVESDKNAIGFSHYYYIDQSKHKSKINLLKVNGVSPTEKNIANAKYPLTIYTYAIVSVDENTMDLESVLEQVDTRIQQKREEQQKEAAESEDKEKEDVTDVEEKKEEPLLKIRFIKWLLSEKGQSLAEKHGFIRHDNPLP
ncbi:MAG: substrate-binding domain-containing protein [Eubacteriales bacterium]